MSDIKLTAYQAVDRIEEVMTILKVRQMCMDDPTHEDVVNYRKRYRALQIGAEAVHKQEMYKWHNLRKNPEELPKIGYTCLCFFDNGDVSAVVRYYDCWVYNELRGLRQMSEEDVDKILAWREIEPFEGGNS